MTSTPALPGYLSHLKSSKELVTTHEQTRLGFVSAALTKAQLASPFIQQARTLRQLALQAVSAQALSAIPDVREGLLAASGTSLKAASVLLKEDSDSIIEDFIAKVLEPAGDDFVEELVYRFLLTKGDTLGGRIRNIAGVWAKKELNLHIQAYMDLKVRDYWWFSGQAEKWLPHTETDGRENAKALRWRNKNGSRTLVYDRKVSQIKSGEDDGEKGGKNVDLVLLDGTWPTSKSVIVSADCMNHTEAFIALGELKGGIDPAGADEHWKTANSALTRIRESFRKLNCSPKLFFVGKAIEESMAAEIWGQLLRGDLSHAANMNNEHQIIPVVAWLCNL